MPERALSPPRSAEFKIEGSYDVIILYVLMACRETYLPLLQCKQANAHTSLKSQ
jgi:hypothetical protein